MLKFSLNVETGFISSGNIVSSSKIPKDKWVFVAWTWNSGGTAVYSWTVYCLDLANKITSSASYNVYPGNVISIGMNTVTYYYEIQAFTSAYGTPADISLYDSNSFSYHAIQISSCPSACSTYCYPGGSCLSTKCCATGCNCPAYDGVCASCIDNSYSIKTQCQCKTGYILSGSSCILRNFYTVPPNCVAGTSAKCTQCESNYFLYDNSTDSTTICLACNSCTTCNASPNCYECIDSIVQDGNACKVDSIGYQLSFDSPNVVIDFAHPLSKNLKVSKFTATTLTHEDIPTTGWDISPLSTAKQYKVVTNLAQHK